MPFEYRNPYTGYDDITGLEVAATESGNASLGGSFTSMARSLGYIADQGGLDQRVATARADARAAGDRDAGQFERATRSMGLTARQRTSANRRLSLNRAVSEAAAGSGVRRRSAANAREALRAGVDLETSAFEQQISALTGLANAAGQKKVRDEQQRAFDREQKDQRNAALVGAGLSLMVALSSEKMKDKDEVNPTLLDKLKGVRVDRWHYKGAKQKHVGPYAEEFNEAFGTEGAGGDKRFINLIDAVGVALGAVKQLDQKVEALAR